MKIKIITAAVLIVLFPALYILSINYFNIFHFFIEFTVLIIGLLIFTIAVIFQKYNSNSITVKLGYGLLPVSLMIFLHNITYDGMNIIKGYDPNLPAQLWLGLSFILSLCILISLITEKIKIKGWMFFSFYLLLGMLITFLCFARLFPVCYIEGKGFTLFNIIGEYFIIAIYFAYISILFVKRKSVIKKTYKDLPIAIIFLIASEFMFAMNFLTFEVQSFLSNYFRLVAFSIIYLDIILANITTPFNTIFADLKESENKLFESEKKFRSMFEYAPLGYQSLDENGRFVEVNNAWLEMFGYEKKEVIGAWFGDFLCAEYVDTFNANFLKFKNNGETCTYFDMSTKSKERITIAFEGKISYDSNGNFKRTHCILQNITEKQESDRKLAESEDRYHSIYDQAQFGICNIALDGQFINANKKCCDMLGYPLEELQTMYIRDVTYKDDIVVGQEQFATMINNNEVKMIMTNRYVTKNGTIKYLDSLTSIIRDSNQKPLYTMVTIEDVTHIKQLEEDNLKMESHLRNQQKLKSIGTLASGVAHEINNPLNGILNYSQIIYDSVDTDSTIAEQAQEIIHETERISLIVKNLLQFSRHEKHSFTKMNVKDMIEQTLSLIKTIIKRDQINLKIELSENLPNIMCRGQQIQQILMNLLTNARDAVNLRYKEYNDNKIIRLTCKTINKSNMPYVQIMVEDHGYGILESVQDKIFDPFFTTKQRDEGTGLGLSISYGIAKEHSGELSFKTKERTYTRFYLELPIDTDKTVAH